MNLKSRSVFKNFSAAFLFLLIVAAVFVPLESAKAAEGWFSFDIFSNIEDWIAKALLGDNVFVTSIYFLIYQFLNIGLSVVKIFVYFGAWLIDVFLDEAIYSTVLNMSDPTSAVSIGWTTVRDACNTFFILFLLLIAFSTILRIQTYSAKSLLPKLIISLFLINFSAVIAMMVIDLGQVFMFEIKTWMGPGGFSDGGKSLTSIVDSFDNKYTWKSPSERFLLEDVVGVGFAVAYSAVLGCLYIMLALFLMVRIIVFVILVIISPFAFFSIILPGMRTYTSQWWSSLVSHAIFGPVFLFFIYLSGKMAQSMQVYTPIPVIEEIDSLSYIIAILIPHVVALGMLFATIFVTQKLGVAGANKFIGGAAGIGKVAMGTYAVSKLAGGLGKKVGGGTVGRAHAGLKGGMLGEDVAKSYNKMADKVGGGIKSLPIVGRIKLESEVAKAQKHKEKVAEKEKLMDNMTDKDKKKYVDSFKLDKNAQAEAQQAMFNLIAKDNGKGLTNNRLQKMGYEKDKLDASGKVMKDAHGNNINVFDKEKFESDYGRAVAHGMDTSNIEKYRPDLIKDKDGRMDKVRKTVADGDEKSIKLDVLLDEDIDKELQELIGRKRYKVLIDSKSQEEKDGLAKGKEDRIIKGLQKYKTNPKLKGALDITSEKGEKELLKQQTEIAYLAGTKDKAQKMRKIKGIKADQSFDYEEDINPKIAHNVINRMDSDDFVDQSPEFLRETAYMIEDINQFNRISRNKYTTSEQSRAIEESVANEMGRTKNKKEYERFESILKTMKSKITRPERGKTEEEKGEERKKREKEEKEEKEKKDKRKKEEEDQNIGYV